VRARRPATPGATQRPRLEANHQTQRAEADPDHDAVENTVRERIPLTVNGCRRLFESPDAPPTAHHRQRHPGAENTKPSPADATTPDATNNNGTDLRL
jgi:hypothetical protein